MILAAILLALVGAPVPVGDGQHRSDQSRAWEARRDGRMMPLREIEKRVVPAMPGYDYLGFDFDSGSAIYTLKFLRDGHVVWVDVDGRSGQVIGRTGK